MEPVPWFRLVPALAAVVVSAWITATRWSTLLAGHPAYPALLAAVALGGVVAAARLIRSPRPATTARAVGTALSVGLLIALGWLRPFPATPGFVPAGSVVVQDTATRIALRPAEPSGAGLVFVPGALVDPRAYLPLLHPLAEAGHPVVVVKPALGIGLLAGGAVGGAVDGTTPQWVVGGHSLGGVAAARYAANAADPRVRGVLFWASYPADDLSGRADLAGLSVSGDRDGLTTPADVRSAAALLPPGSATVVLPGAIHAHFGDYGPQPGDGTAGIPRGQAQREIVEATGEFLGGF